MKNHIFVTVTSMALCGSVQAQSLGFSDDGYVTVFGGVTVVEASANRRLSPLGAVQIPTDFDMDDGYSLGLTVGLRITDRARAEVELSYGSNDVTGLNSSAAGVQAPAAGRINDTFLMANVWYDIPVSGPLRPYLGAGVGVGRVDGSDLRVNRALTPVSGSSTELAGQLGFGGRWELGSGGVIDLGYRYRKVGFSGQSYQTPTGRFSLEDGELDSHSLNLGYSFSF